MIKHIVFWRFKENALGKSKQENLIETKAVLETLKDRIQEVRSLEVGINFNPAPHAFDLALYSEFETRQDLETYQDHRAHREAVEFLSRVRDERIVVDYETS